MAKKRGGNKTPRSSAAAKTARTKEVNKQFYQLLLEEAGGLDYFQAPADRGGFDFAFQIDEIVGVRAKKTPITDKAATRQAKQSFDLVQGEKIKLVVDFEYQGPDGVSHTATRETDEFYWLDRDDVLEAYYDLAGDYADEVYAEEGTSGGFSFSVSHIGIVLA